VDEESQHAFVEFGAYRPPEIARLVEQAGVAKAALPVRHTLVLAVLAGAFIAFGAMTFTMTITGSGLGFGPARLLGGLAFSLGLVLVVIAGAELFTGNNMIVMAWAARKISSWAMLKNWSIVYAGNFVGAVATAVLVHLSGVNSLGGGDLGVTAVEIARAKIGLPFAEAFFRGVLCNTLVCLAVWLSYAAHTVPGKILAVIFPVTAFVAMGFEHSIANMYFISIGMLAGAGEPSITLLVDSFLGKLVPVTLGNIVGGSVFVALVYWIVYLRPREA
jgi:formate/nitrite transporter